MNILMFGWEFPPAQSGGLGVACHGITEGLMANGHNVFLVLPKVIPEMASAAPGINLKAANESGVTLETIAIPSTLYSPYANAQGYKTFIKATQGGNAMAPEVIYGKNLIDEVYRYAAQASAHALTTPHDVIHTHDWLTVEAGIQAKKLSGKPHVMHVHATEFDRSGENPNQQVYDIERRGMHEADRVIAVSEYTKKMLIKYYGVPEWKIDVVHNAVKPDVKTYQKNHLFKKDDHVVLFLGRMTMQKGPDYFLKMAKRVLSKMQNVKFIMAGDGDMMEQVINLAVELDIERHVLFSGFLKGDEIARAYSSADLYVMPSVSEPFGIAPLEAIRHGAPVLISKQSGVSEVIKNALRADFWDVDEMANQVLSALTYPSLKNTLKQHAHKEVDRLSWFQQAKHIIASYLKAYEKNV